MNKILTIIFLALFLISCTQQKQPEYNPRPKINWSLLQTNTEAYCLQFTPNNCPSECEVGPSCPICQDIGCHSIEQQKPIHEYYEEQNRRWEKKHQDDCTNSQGNWKNFSLSCTDWCQKSIEELYGNLSHSCANVETNGCDCGPNKCWNGTGCTQN